MIGFLQPLALLALFAAAVPPLLHLMSRKEPPVVLFPALRYLTETERRQSRRVKLRHLLLMILRTLIVAIIALAASRPVARIPFGSAHEPSAVTLVLDNSLSSGVIDGGRRRLDMLRERARQLLQRIDPTDRLWMVVADGAPRSVHVAEAKALLDTLGVWPVRLDLSLAIRNAATAMADGASAGREIVVISDGQASAFTAGAEVVQRVLVWEWEGTVLDNRGVDSVWSEPTIWSPQGQVVGVIGGSGGTKATVRLTLAGRDVARTIGGVGDRVVLAGMLDPGWHISMVQLDPDELRADDRRQVAVRVATPGAVTATAETGVFVTQALEVLQQAGRARVGNDVLLTDRPGGGKAVVFPPADPALVGSVNRMLDSRGIGWRFGELVSGEWDLAGAPTLALEDATVYRRRRLVGDGTVIARVGGGGGEGGEAEPWIVRDHDVILVGSRMEPEWSTLPLSAGFIPFLDVLVNRVAAREAWIVDAAPGAQVTLPPTVDGVLLPDGSVMLPDAGSIASPLVPGVYFLRGAGSDTVGALQVSHDPRESRLDRVTTGELRAAVGPAAMLLDEGGIARELFRGARRADLTGALVLLALILALAEISVATMGGGHGWRRGRA